jgi:hypothetical protein
MLSFVKAIVSILYIVFTLCIAYIIFYLTIAITK